MGPQGTSWGLPGDKEEGKGTVVRSREGEGNERGRSGEGGRERGKDGRGQEGDGSEVERLRKRFLKQRKDKN